ncbi:YfhO family protein [Secundilactobacillus folii]|nr:YfhO family protein [Secundilactobacillus folii]
MARLQKLSSKMILAGLLTIVCLTVIFGYYRITPFGSNNLLVGDMSAQYVQFLTYFRHIFLGGHFETFSFTFGVGENMVPMMAYYLMSPFNLLVLLVSTSHIPTIITLIFMLKMACISATMTYFLAKHTGQSRWSAVIFGVAFSLCGFIVADYLNIMWLDSLIYLPLIADGIDRLDEKSGKIRLFVWLTLSLLSNYYLGYITGIFTLIYFIYVRYVRHESLRSRMSVDFVVTEGLSVFSSMAILLPTLMGMLKTAKVASVAAEFALRPMFGWEIVSQLGSGSENYTNRLSHAPAIFITLTLTLLVFSYFVNKTIDSRKKKAALTVFIIMLLSMFIQPLNTAWHMFHQPAGSPFRDAFLVSFLAITLAYEAWIANPRMLSKTKQAGIVVGTQLLLISGFLYLRLAKNGPSAFGLARHYGYQPNSAAVLLVNLVVVAIAGSLIFVRAKRQNMLTLGVLATVMGESIFNFGYELRHAPLGNQAGYKTDIAQESKLFTQLPSSQALYRTNFTGRSLPNSFKGTAYSGYNDSLLYNFNGIKQYDSTMNEQTRESLKSLGLYSKNARRISNLGLTSVSAFLLGVRYEVNTQTGVTKNPNYIGMGFPVSSRFKQLTLHKKAILTNLRTILQAIKPSQKAYFLGLKKSQKSASPVITKTGRHPYAFQVKTKVSGPVYLDSKSTMINNSSIIVNGKPLNIMGTVNNTYLVNLGNYAANRKLTIRISAKNASVFSKVHVVDLDMNRFHSLVTAQTGFKPQIKRNSITGTVTRTNSKDKYLYASIPYDSGWHATVNGRRVKVSPALNNFMTIPLRTGKNRINLTYHVPGLATGWVLSALGVLSFGAFAIYRRRRN